MKTEEFVKAVAMKMKEIVELNKKWNPDNEYLSVAWINGSVQFNTDPDEDENGERKNYIMFWTDETENIGKAEVYSDSGVEYYLRREKK